MFPWARKKNHEEEPMHPLLQTCTFGGDNDGSSSSVFVQGSDESLVVDGGDVDMENAVKHPTGLVVDQVNRPNH